MFFRPLPHPLWDGFTVLPFYPIFTTCFLPQPVITTIVDFWGSEAIDDRPKEVRVIAAGGQEHPLEHVVGFRWMGLDGFWDEHWRFLGVEMICGNDMWSWFLLF